MRRHRGRARHFNPTIALVAVGPRRPERRRPALDEMEKLRGDKDRFDARITVLNVGSERDGVMTRLEKCGERFVEEPYEGYAPRALAEDYGAQGRAGGPVAAALHAPQAPERAGRVAPQRPRVSMRMPIEPMSGRPYS